MWYEPHHAPYIRRLLYALMSCLGVRSKYWVLTSWDWGESQSTTKGKSQSCLVKPKSSEPSNAQSRVLTTSTPGQNFMALASSFGSPLLAAILNFKDARSWPLDPFSTMTCNLNFAWEHKSCRPLWPRTSKSFCCWLLQPLFVYHLWKVACGHLYWFIYCHMKVTRHAFLKRTSSYIFTQFNM